MPYALQAGRCPGQLAAQFSLPSRLVPAVAALLCAIFGPAQGYFFQIGGAPSFVHRSRVGSGPIQASRLLCFGVALEWYSPVSGRQWYVYGKFVLLFL